MWGVSFIFLKFRYLMNSSSCKTLRFYLQRGSLYAINRENKISNHLFASLPPQFLPQSCSGQSLFEGMRDSEKFPRHQSCDIHTRNCRNSKHNCPKHNCSTQTDTCSCDRGDEACKDTGDSLDGSGSSAHHKPFSNSSLHSRSLSSSHSPSESHPDFSYRRHDLHHRPFTFTPVPSDCSSPQTPVDQVQSSPAKPSGGTWPKVIAVASISEFAQLSIYKKVKQRKSIFDVNAFRRPEAPPKLDYMSLSQMPKHSPQSSMSESAQAPPTPPTRSDSFRFKHRQQNSSASDSTITTGTPPASPAQATIPIDEGEAGNQLYYTDTTPGKTKSSSVISAEDEGSRRRAEERGKRRYRPKSAPALRRNVTPLHIPVPMQVTEILFLSDPQFFICVSLWVISTVWLLPAGTEFF